MRHSGIQQLLVEGSAGVLESSITVEQRVCIWIFQNGFIQGIKNKLIVIPVTNDITDDSPVTQVKDGTQIEFVDDRTFIPLKTLSHRSATFHLAFLPRTPGAEDSVLLPVGRKRFWCSPAS